MFMCMESLVRYRDLKIYERRLIEGIRVKKVQKIKAQTFNQIIMLCFKMYRERQSDEVLAITVRSIYLINLIVKTGASINVNSEQDSELLLHREVCLFRENELTASILTHTLQTATADH